MDAGQQQADLERARRGDCEAVGRLLVSFQPYLRYMARAFQDDRLVARLEVSDLVQEALLEAHRGFAAFRGETVAELASWLRRIVIGTAQRWRRAYVGTSKRDIRREVPAEALADQLADSGNSPSAQMMRHEQAARVAQAVAQLPDDMQEVLLGRHLDGLAYAVLAERLGRSEGALRVLYTRALRRLRELLSEPP
jgi:RNA polymerase sigma-70 factor, ECF subfamily